MKSRRHRSGETGCDRRRHGVTLLELVAVVVIIGIIASVSAVGFRRSMKNAQRRLAVETMLLCDGQCRTLADRSNRIVVLEYDAKARQLKRRSTGSRGRGIVLANDIDLPGVWSDRSGADPDSIRFFGNGQSDTYGVIDHNGQCHLVLGATGQQIVLPDRSQAQELLNVVQVASRSVID